MLFPDETYEDYHRRINSSKSNQSKTTHSRANSPHRSLEERRSHKSRNNSAKSQGSSGRESAGGSTSNSGSYKKTKDFFENIPEIEDEHLPSNYEQHAGRRRTYKHSKTSKDNDGFEDDPSDLSTNPIFLRKCEAFIQHYRIRPDFFCQYYKAIR
ncbi:uncharacterized protein LOC142224531 [Haematobia irritans]|uniref:uncharacterized protein LOC142224531 n=1 Tax=Haematobia irritans TaxID=7368 RepID=UPI003F502545